MNFNTPPAGRCSVPSGQAVQRHEQQPEHAPPVHVHPHVVHADPVIPVGLLLLGVVVQLVPDPLPPGAQHPQAR